MKYFILIVIGLLATSGIANASNERGASHVYSKKEERCLALNLYHETRGEPLNGMLAVGQVVLNRVSDERYPDTICDVVSEDRSGGTQCQFSWWCELDDKTPYEQRAWVASKAVSHAVLHDGDVPHLVENVLHYVHCDVQRQWLNPMSLYVKIGQHCFYLDDDGRWEDHGKDPDPIIIHSAFALVEKNDNSELGMELVYVPSHLMAAISERSNVRK